MSGKELDKREQDAARYRRLQVLGCAVAGTKQLDAGTVVRWSCLDAFVDADIAARPSRGEATEFQSGASPVTSTDGGEQMVPKHLLNGRDDFIVSKGLWSEFMATLTRPDSGDGK